MGLYKKKMQELTTNNRVHKIKASVFYRKKRAARLTSRSCSQRQAICMDYQKNLHLPNVTTNDVYYRRQLIFMLFNIHVLSTSESLFFVYDETVAKKGATEVCSFLFYYIMFCLEGDVKHLEIFCDSACGQNKNWSVFRLIHYIVHHTGRLDSIKITFPVRGHSYLECDKNMALINQKKRAELPEDWIEELQTARKRPTSFNVVEVDENLVRGWPEFLKPFYEEKCPFATRPIKEIAAEKAHPRFLKYRNTYSGAWEAVVVNKPGSVKPRYETGLPCTEATLPSKFYSGK